MRAPRKCPQCRHAMKTKRENHRYDACGLPRVTLRNVELSRCPNCGEWEVHIPKIEGLHQAIAQSVIQKREPLTPEEIRFLRKHLGLERRDFAAHMDVSPETVSRWEVGRQPMSTMAERLLRLMVASQGEMAYPLEQLREAGTLRPSRTAQLGLKVSDGRWRAA